jgi:hypothetical protein
MVSEDINHNEGVFPARFLLEFPNTTFLQHLGSKFGIKGPERAHLDQKRPFHSSALVPSCHLPSKHHMALCHNCHRKSGTELGESQQCLMYSDVQEDNTWPQRGGKSCFFFHLFSNPPPHQICFSLTVRYVDSHL